ncbi:uncharacterized protein F4807DRAFT_460781 [Annulohypoxylon truncatum]|uniref:uncharacterized protein n=1 Tax=Annulohypoxylon truncatum TaxID=327061 RepID=UPI00200853DF|nr:uncharacterized protein F4807DRAFT_460781 [Annulohypoxylon truncatum]KAI1209564.1 hypothetical protein F4807DRAFT_460781 [Annulohypoxylon truncatum]
MTAPAPAHIRAARHQHRDYSRKTKIFKKWLLEAAVQCGWNQNDEPTKTSDILSQIDIILKAEVQEISMPKHIYETLVSAIDLRKEALEAFGEVHFIGGQSMTAHLHFIAILEHALDVLPKSEHTIKSNSPTTNVPQRPPTNATNPSSEDDDWSVVRYYRRSQGDRESK